MTDSDVCSSQASESLLCEDPTPVNKHAAADTKSKDAVKKEVFL